MMFKCVTAWSQCKNIYPNRKFVSEHVCCIRVKSFLMTTKLNHQQTIGLLDYLVPPSWKKGQKDSEKWYKVWQREYLTC